MSFNGLHSSGDEPCFIKALEKEYAYSKLLNISLLSLVILICLTFKPVAPPPLTTWLIVTLVTLTLKVTLSIN